MKNLNTRTKILLAIAGVLVVAVVAVAVFSQPRGEDLSGAALVGVTPSNPTIVVGQTVTLSANTALLNCSWSSANTAVATVTSNNKSAVVKGVTVGQVKIDVKCGVGLTTGSTTVTVNPPPTITPTPTPTPTRTPTPLPFSISPVNPFIGVGADPITLTAVNAVGTCTWSGQQGFSYFWIEACGSGYHCIMVQPFSRDRVWTRAEGNVVFPMSVTCNNGQQHASTNLTWGIQNP